MRVFIKKKRILIWLPIVMAAIFLPLFILYQKGYFLPVWAVFKEKEAVYDIGGESYRIILKNKGLTVIKNGREGGDSEEEYLFDKDLKIEDYLVGDIDHDLKDELILLFFRRSSYGPYKPFWVKEDENVYSQHIGIYEFGFDNDKRINERYLAEHTGNKDGKRVISQKWVSSGIGAKIVSIELNKDNELVIREKNGKESCWYYSCFGLMLKE
ncbi:MAG: hypothetical protein K5931_02995 [Lachnospiraceae bacterium]|nr:hypothetical protein [Lachnospiraceae bacterium]